MAKIYSKNVLSTTKAIIDELRDHIIVAQNFIQSVNSRHPATNISDALTDLRNCEAHFISLSTLESYIKLTIKKIDEICEQLNHNEEAKKFENECKEFLQLYVKTLDQLAILYERLNFDVVSLDETKNNYPKLTNKISHSPSSIKISNSQTSSMLTSKESLEESIKSTGPLSSMSETMVDKIRHYISSSNLGKKIWISDLNDRIDISNDEINETKFHDEQPISVLNELESIIEEINIILIQRRFVSISNRMAVEATDQLLQVLLMRMGVSKPDFMDLTILIQQTDAPINIKIRLSSLKQRWNSILKNILNALSELRKYNNLWKEFENELTCSEKYDSYEFECKKSRIKSIIELLWPVLDDSSKVYVNDKITSIGI